jgi:hypothetical protein
MRENTKIKIQNKELKGKELYQYLILGEQLSFPFILSLFCFILEFSSCSFRFHAPIKEDPEIKR